MKKLIGFLTVAFFVGSTACAWAQLKEGLWDFTTQVQIKGMPKTMPATTFRQCVTKSNPVPQNKDKSFDCKITNQNISGDTISYSMECKGDQGVMQTTGKTTYSGNTMEGSSTTVFKMKGQPPMQMSNTMKGKYLGPCPK
ncbi:MAG TPA: DUF3617 family protein [Smithella sp.]|nr:DUF3617 family protein [Smithella sp.]